MKARRTILASLNWRHLHSLDTQCWQRIPPFNYAVVTMDTTSTPISITLHMALCEGHTSSEIQLKASEMKALTLHAWWTISGWRSWLNWMFLTSSSHAWAANGTLIMVKNWRYNWIMRDLNLTWLDTFTIRVHVLLQACIYTSIHELTHMKHNPMHTLPQNASIIQTQSYSACFSCFYQIFLLLGCSPGSNSARLENFNLVYSFFPLPSPCQSGSNSGISSAPTHLTCHGQSLKKKIF